MPINPDPADIAGRLAAHRRKLAGRAAAHAAETAPALRTPPTTLGGIGRQSQDRPEWRACR